MSPYFGTAECPPLVGGATSIFPIFPSGPRFFSRPSLLLVPSFFFIFFCRSWTGVVW